MESKQAGNIAFKAQTIFKGLAYLYHAFYLNLRYIVRKVVYLQPFSLRSLEAWCKSRLHHPFCNEAQRSTPCLKALFRGKGHVISVHSSAFQDVRTLQLNAANNDAILLAKCIQEALQRLNIWNTTHLFLINWNKNNLQKDLQEDSYRIESSKSNNKSL
jgi:hypothetical protein